MEGIPPEDVKEHEKQKSGIKTFIWAQVKLFGLMYVPTLFFYYAWDTSLMFIGV